MPPSPLTLQAAHVSRDLAIAGLSAFWQPADSRLPGDQWLTEHEHHHLVPDESWNVLQPLDCTLELRLNLPGQQPNGAHSSLHVGATVPVMSVHLQQSELADITRQAVWDVCSDDHSMCCDVLRHLSAWLHNTSTLCCLLWLLLVIC